MRGLPCVGEVFFDATTAILSVADIAFDVAVAVEFYQAGKTFFFAVSLGIFVLAQCCYAFLFVATYGDHLSNTRKTCGFIATLPFSQLVPVFTLVESFHFSSTASALACVGLRPTTRADVGNAGDTDSLWALCQRKYHAHAGAPPRCAAPPPARAAPYEQSLSFAQCWRTCYSTWALHHVDGSVSACRPMF